MRWGRFLLVLCVAVLGQSAALPARAAFITDNIFGGGVGFVPELFDASPALFWPVFVAADRGFFRKEHLDVASDAVSSIGYQTCETAVQTAFDERRNDFRIVGMLVNALPFRLNATVARAGDLAGKSVVLRAKADASTALFERWLAANGVPRASVTERFDISAPNRYVDIADGGAAAALLPQPYATFARDGGSRTLLDDAVYAPRIAYVCLTAGRSYADGHSAELHAYLSAVSSALAWLRDPQHRDDAVAVLQARTKLSRSVVEAMYDEIVADAPFSAGLALDRQSFANVVDLMKESGSIPPDAAPGPLLDPLLDGQYLPQ